MKLRLLSGLALPGLLLSGLAAATDVPVPAADTSVAVDGLTVAIDAKTGRIRPMTAADRAALTNAASHSSFSQPARPGMRRSTQPRTTAEAVATRRTLRNGRGQSMRVGESMMTQLNVTLDANGKPVISETSGDQPTSAPAQAEAIQ